MESTPSALSLEPTSKQQKLLNEFDCLLSRIGINYELNPNVVGRSWTSPVALDVEHDESGGFVGCGLWDGNGDVSYWDDLAAFLHIPFHALSVIAHNGVSDLEALRLWGCDIKDTQLVWDTMLIEHINDSSLGSYSLKDIAARSLGIEYPSYDDIVGKRGLKAERVTLDRQPPRLVAMYNTMDVYVTKKIEERQRRYGCI